MFERQIDYEILYRLLQNGGLDDFSDNKEVSERKHGKSFSRKVYTYPDKDLKDKTR